MFKIICLSILIVYGLAGLLELREQIQNTEQLIYLYEEKLRILKGIYEKQYPDIPHPTASISPQRRNITSTDKSSPQLALINQFEYPSLLFQDKYLISNNQVINVETREPIAEFMGDVLIVEASVITTLVGGKVNMVGFKEQVGKVRAEEYFLGLSGDKLDSIWHRNYNIKDGQDLLVQWQNNKIYFRGKDVNSITMPSEEKILSIYSLNQYKVIFVSSHRIGIVNSRSLQIGQCEHVKNITRMKNNASDNVRIVQSYRQDGFIIILLSTGELGKYYNQKIVNIQLLSGLSYSNFWEHQLKLQYVHPYLFIADKDAQAFKVYYNQMNKFEQLLNVNVDSKHPSFAFYKQHESYRAAISTVNETKIYEIMIPKVEEPVVSMNYFKFVGIFALVACFIYFKWFRKSQETEIAERKEATRKYAQFERVRAGQERQDSGKEKKMYTQSQIEEFLKKQAREHHKKSN